MNSTRLPIDLHDPVTPELERLLSEERLSCAQAARMFGVSAQSVWRWIHHGKRGVRLEGFCLGGGLATTRQAVARFSAALTARRLGQPLPEKAPSQAERERRAAAAWADMQRMRAEARQQRAKDRERERQAQK